MTTVFLCTMYAPAGGTGLPIMSRVSWRWVHNATSKHCPECNPHFIVLTPSADRTLLKLALPLLATVVQAVASAL
jgi:hypothetical protein